MLADIGISIAGTLASQVVGFTPESLGFTVKRLSLRGRGAGCSQGPFCLGCWRAENAGWMEVKQEGDREEEEEAEAVRESWKWFEGDEPNCVKEEWEGTASFHTELLNASFQKQCNFYMVFPIGVDVMTFKHSSVYHIVMEKCWFIIWSKYLIWQWLDI